LKIVIIALAPAFLARTEISLIFAFFHTSTN
jgi:hypothetical protein